MEGWSGVPIAKIQLAFLKPDSQALSDEPFKAEEHLAELAEKQKEWKTVEVGNGGGKKWDWDLWKFEGEVEGVEEGWVVVARAGMYIAEYVTIVADPVSGSRRQRSNAR